MHEKIYNNILQSTPNPNLYRIPVSIYFTSPIVCTPGYIDNIIYTVHSGIFMYIRVHYDNEKLRFMGHHFTYITNNNNITCMYGVRIDVHVYTYPEEYPQGHNNSEL